MGPLDPSRLGAFLMRQMPPADSEVVERGNVLPLGTYRTPDGRETTTLAFPQPMREGLDALAYALGYRQDPNAPAGYVTHDALNKGGQGLAESAMVGSLGARAPAGALRSGMAKPDLDPSQAARMARAKEMGFDVQGYHGTGSGDFPEFKGITWMSESPALANDYAAMRGQGDGWDITNPHSVMKIMGRSGNVFDADRMPKTIKRSEFINEIVEQAQEQGRLTNESEIARVRDLAEIVVKAAQREESGPHYGRHDFWNNVESQFGDDGAKALSEIFDLAGFDSIRMIEGGEATIGIRSPFGVRSVNAMFDPAKSDSANLLAANPMAGAVPLAFPAPQEDRNQALARFLASGGA